MLDACVPLLVALLVGLPSTATAQTLDHQQMDISGALGTNAASPGDFDGEHLSKHPMYSFEDDPKVDELSFINVLKPENPTGFDNKDEIKIHKDSSDMQGLVRRSSNILQYLEKKTKSSFPCPEPTDIAPCVCSLTDNDLVLDCSDVESSEQLAEVFKHDFPVKQFNVFQIIFNNNIQYLIDVFNGVSFEYIYLSQVTNLREVSKYALFDSRNTLKEIHVHYALLDENTFPFDTLDEFPKLTFVVMDGTNINIWPAFSSSSITGVQFLYGNISEIPASKIY